jgi:3',5'-cyclic AMP phosphodiesterase CpdA
VSEITVAHLGDLHFGRDIDLAQIEEIETFVPGLRPDAVVLSGDLTQRARHGEFQAALALVRRLEAAAPTLVIPGNHDVQWWLSPFGIRGQRVKYAKYRQYFGEVLAPALRLPGLVVAGLLTSHGVSLASMTWNLNDLAVKGHLPKSEVTRVKGLFERAPAGAAKVAVVHHNVLRGEISGRMGLARWTTAQRRLLGLGADVVLCSHDHQEGAGQIGDRLPVSTAGTHASRSRGGRPAVFNLIRVSPGWVQIEHVRWDAAERCFRRGDMAAFARPGNTSLPQADGIRTGA